MPVHEGPVPQLTPNTTRLCCHPCAAAAGATLGSFLIALLHFLMELMLFQTHDRGRCARAAVLCFCCVGFVPSSLGSCLLCWQATVSTADRPVRDWAAAGLPPPAYATSPPTSAGSHHHLPPRPAYPRLPACLQASPACGWRWAGTTTWAWQAGLSPPCLRTLPSHRRTIKGA